MATPGVDRPSIGAGILRIALGLGFVALGGDKFVRHSVALADFQRWHMPSPATTVYVVAVVEIACGLLLLVGLLPRLAALVMLADMVVRLLTAGRYEGGPQWAEAGGVAVVCLIAFIAGGGRWALIDRVDPAPPRRLVREP